MAYSLKQLMADVKGTLKETPNTVKNIKSLMAKKHKKKKGEKRVDIYSQGQKRKQAMEDAGNLSTK